MRRPPAPSTSLTAVSAATTPSSPGLNSATSELIVDRAKCRIVRTNRDSLRAKPRMVRTIRTSGLGLLDHPQFPARLFRHALWGPHGLVDDVDAGIGDARQRQQVVA